MSEAFLAHQQYRAFPVVQGRQGLTDPAPGLVLAWSLPFAVLCLPLLAFQLVQWWLDDLEPVERFPFALRVALYAALAAGIVLLGEDFGAPFIYFQF